MSDMMHYALIVRWRDGEQETISEHSTLRAAATRAFDLADKLSLPGLDRDAAEVALVRGDDLQLSIAIIPGEPLTKRHD